MKNSLLFLLLSLLTLAIVSCRNESEPEPEPIIATVDSSKIKPQIDIEFTMLDSGYVQIVNNSKKIIAADYRFNDDFVHPRTWSTREINPKIFFYSNGVKEIYAHLRFENGLGDTTVIRTIEVTKAPNEGTLTSDSKITGTYLNSSIATDHPHMFNTFGGVGIAVQPYGTPLTTAFFGEGSNRGVMVLADYNETQGVDFQPMLDNLKPGLKPLKNRNIPKRNGPGWTVLFPSISTGPALGGNESDSLFIEETKVIYQPKIIPEMTDKAILVKMRIKGNFEGHGKIDFVMQYKFYHYKEVFR